MKILNRKAYYEYFIIKEYVCGIKLISSEVKSLSRGEANMQDSYCYVFNNEVFVKGLHIAKNKMSSYNNHEEKRDRKLLLTKREIRGIIAETKANNGMTIIPLEIFKQNGKFKLKISLSRGKKMHDRRNAIKEKEAKKQISSFI